MIASRSLGGVVVAALLLVAACGGHVTRADVDSTSIGSTRARVAGAPGVVDSDADRVREVPEEYGTVQAAIDAAREGDLVLVGDGTYHESIDVVTDGVTIRGLDRDGVVLDGRLELDHGIRVLGANGVAVENLTVMNYTNDAVSWISANGFRASYVTTYRTGGSGIDVFDSVHGQIEHAHTVGSRDAGIHVSQCYPCDTVVDDVESSYNGFGYSGTNAGGNLLVVDSVWHHNRAGIVLDSGSFELCPPQRETAIVGNLVVANNESTTPPGDRARSDRSGILVVGGVRNVIERNRVVDHAGVGIGLGSYREPLPNDVPPSRDEWERGCDEQKRRAPEPPGDATVWGAIENRIADNVVTGSRKADLAVASLGSELTTLGNCFEGNEFETTAPAGLEVLAPCDGADTGRDGATGGISTDWSIGDPSWRSLVLWRETQLPTLGDHLGMTDAATAAAHPATDLPDPVDLDAISVPDLATR